MSMWVPAQPLKLSLSKRHRSSLSSFSHNCETRAARTLAPVPLRTHSVSLLLPPLFPLGPVEIRTPVGSPPQPCTAQRPLLHNSAPPPLAGSSSSFRGQLRHPSPPRPRQLLLRAPSAPPTASYRGYLLHIFLPQQLANSTACLIHHSIPSI